MERACQGHRVKYSPTHPFLPVQWGLGELPKWPNVLIKPRTRKFLFSTCTAPDLSVLACSGAVKNVLRNYPCYLIKRALAQTYPCGYAYSPLVWLWTAGSSKGDSSICILHVRQNSSSHTMSVSNKSCALTVRGSQTSTLKNGNDALPNPAHNSHAAFFTSWNKESRRDLLLTFNG